MKMFLTFVFLFFIQCLSNGFSKCDKLDANVLKLYNNEELYSESQNGSKLLIILVDGFRWDYVSRDQTLKGFPRIAKIGVQAQYVKPIFPENSYPNWYTIVTGLYSESHGIIQNYMFDNQTNDFFLMGPNPNVSHTHWWNQSEPIWITAEKSGIKSALYLWDGCQVTIRGTKPTVCVPYHPIDKTNSNETQNNLGIILNDFVDNKYRLALLYHGYVDESGHSFGPNSNQTKEAIRDIDSIIYDLYESIVRHKLDQQLNVVIVSDHGMTQLDRFKQIDLKEVIDSDSIHIFLGYGSGAQIVPKPNKEELIYEQLKKIKGLKVYKRDEIPESFHYKHNRLVLPLLVTVDYGYELLSPKIANNIVWPPPGVSPKKGNHGYGIDQVQDMRAIMYGFGPAFTQNFVSEPLTQVDHYNLFCNLIGMTPNPNNGTFAKVKPFLKNY